MPAEEAIGGNSGLRAAPAELREFLAGWKDRQAEVDQLREIMKEEMHRMKARGYDTKALRVLIKRAKETAAQREARSEVEAAVEMYGSVIGMFG